MSYLILLSEKKKEDWNGEYILMKEKMENKQRKIDRIRNKGRWEVNYPSGSLQHDKGR